MWALLRSRATGDHRLDEVVPCSTSHGCSCRTSIRAVRILVLVVVEEHPEPRVVVFEADGSSCGAPSPLVQEPIERYEHVTPVGEQSVPPPLGSAEVKAHCASKWFCRMPPENVNTPSPISSPSIPLPHSRATARTAISPNEPRCVRIRDPPALAAKRARRRSGRW